MIQPGQDITKVILFSIALALVTSTLTYFVHRQLDKRFGERDNF